MNDPAKQQKPSVLRRVSYFFRRLFFKNKLGERIILLLADYSGTYKLSRKLIVPANQYALNSYRNTSRNNSRLKLDLSNEVDHFIFFKNKDTSFDHLEDEIKKASVILDIGGNIGAFALLFEKLAPQAAVYTFEPHHVTFSRLKENLTLNQSKVNSYNFGLGEAKGKFKMYEIDSHNTGMNRILKEEQALPFSIIEIEAFDEFWDNRGKIDFVKIDVEGFELSVLKGAINTFKKYYPTLVIELDDNNLRSNGGNAEELITFLDQNGYNEIFTSDKKNKIDSNSNFQNCHFDIIAKRAAP